MLQMIPLSNMDPMHRLAMSAKLHPQGHTDFGAFRPYAVTNEKGQEAYFVNIGGKAIRIDNALLRKNEWVEMDTAVRAAAHLRMPTVDFLMGRGLVYSLDGMRVSTIENHNISELDRAKISMSGYAAGGSDDVDHGLQGLPLPIIFKDWDIPWRTWNISRNGGVPLDVSQAEAMSRVVGEEVERMYYSGLPNFAHDSYAIYGVTNFPSRNTGTLTAKWSTATGSQMVDDVISMKAASQAARHYGPWVLEIPGAYDVKLDDDFKAEVSGTIRERILAINGIEEIIVSDFLSVDNVILAELSTETQRIVDGMAPTNLQWTSEGDMKLNMKVMTIRVPQLRADHAGNSGITHFNKT